MMLLQRTINFIDVISKYLSLLLLIASLNGLILGIVFILKSPKALSSYFFSFFILALSYILLMQFLHVSGGMIVVPHLLATSTPVLFLISPLLFIYIKIIFTQQQRFSELDILHFLPFLISVATIIPFYLSSGEFKVEYIRSSQSGPVSLPWTRSLYYLIALIQCAYYYLAIGKIIRINQGSVFVTYGWITYLKSLYGIFIIAFASTIFLLFVFPGHFREIRLGGYLILAMIGQTHTVLLLWHGMPKRLYKSPSPQVTDDENLLRIKNELTDKLITEEIYLNPNLKIKELAETLDTSAPVLSAIINTEYACNFNSLINHYRVAKAKELLSSEDYEKFSIDGIASHCGFNNRTTLYRAFLKETGKTPKDYRSNNTSI